MITKCILTRNSIILLKISRSTKRECICKTWLIRCTSKTLFFLFFRYYWRLEELLHSSSEWKVWQNLPKEDGRNWPGIYLLGWIHGFNVIGYDELDLNDEFIIYFSVKVVWSLPICYSDENSNESVQQRISSYDYAM